MDFQQIAVQLYTLRDHCKTDDDFARTLERVRALGYTAVQISAVHLDPTLVRQRCDEAGLTICATHEGSQKIVDDPQWVVEKLQILGCTATAYPHPHVALKSLADVERLAEQLTSSGAILARHGLVLTYHNHSLEFHRFQGKSILQHLFDLTPARYVQAELDTFWVQKGGQDPVRWITQMQGRVPLLHLKDYELKEVKDEPTFGSIGDGNLDWPAILRAGVAAGTRWFIVEQDAHWIDNDPFKALERSARYLQQLCPTI